MINAHSVSLSFESFDKKTKYNSRVPIWGAPFTVDVSKPKPNRSNTMNLVEKRASKLGLCEDAFNGRAGSLEN